MKGREMKIVRGEIERDEEGKYLVKLLNHRERDKGKKMQE